MDSWRINCVSHVFPKSSVSRLTLLAFFSIVIPVFPTTFVFDGFNGTDLILEAGASIIPSQSALALTNHTHWVLGRALYSTPVQIKSNGTLSSFSTTFVFSMVHLPSDEGGHGLTFILTPYSTLMGGLSSGYLGLLNITTNGQPYNHLFAVEFDTVQSMEMDDPNNNHVGLDINNLISVLTETAGYWDGKEFHEISQGGFGRVYKGVLPRSGKEVAVKSITKELKWGMRGFVAEISTMGRMQHRNLVPLRGWCRMKKQLFIIYDYMPNCSLDKLIFGNPTTALPWHRRYAILKDVATGLLYLHEQWEKRVIHRDIKSSNVLLDSELNGRLGDFGLARLYEHSENPGTTQLVGTPGYIAPELTRTAKATPSSDVFSFGVLLLEVACGRKPLDLSADGERLYLVDWVWELYAHASLLSVADPKLGDEYDIREMEVVLKLGLLCTNTEPKARPGIGQVCQILKGEASLPDAHMDRFSVNGGASTADPEDRFVREIQSGNPSNGWLSSTSLPSPR